MKVHLQQHLIKAQRLKYFILCILSSHRVSHCVE